jgi:hypothetical protein
MSTATIDDADSAIQYTPVTGAWKTNSDPTFKESSLHYTSFGGAQSTFSFNGEALGIYGTASLDHGPMKIEIDGMVATTQPYSGVSKLHVQTLVVSALP